MKVSDQCTDPYNDVSVEAFHKIRRSVEFLAYCTKPLHTNVDDLKGPLNCSLIGLWSLRDALERTPPDNADPESALRLAAVWIQEAGTPIRYLSLKGFDFEGEVGAGGDLVSDRNWKGFNRDRWNFWRGRLAVIKASGAFKKILRDAEQSMLEFHEQPTMKTD